MGKLTIISAIIAVVLFIVMFTISGIAVSQSEKKEIKDGKEREKESALIYLYADDTNTDIVFTRVDDKTDFKIDYSPSKPGYTFVGWYTSPVYNDVSRATDSQGNSLKPIENATVLYPIFVKSVE